ncbi:MAG: hypothetical protein ABIL58_23450 [Pseudomonadota bacterium]
MQRHKYPEKAKTDGLARALRAAQEAWVIGANVQRCPHCRGPLSHDLGGNPFCRGCHHKTKLNTLRLVGAEWR